MRYPPDHKEKTRQRIVDAAARLFRRDGYHATGVDGVMAEAGLTAGAFYGHFESKEDLLREVMAGMFEGNRDQREEGLGGATGLAFVEGLITNYLSIDHLREVEGGCPLPALTPELSRAGAGVRADYQRQMTCWVDELCRVLADDPGCAGLPPDELRSMAAGSIAAMVGGMSIARVLPDEERAVGVLDGARRFALAALHRQPPPVEVPARPPAPSPD